MTTTPEPLDVLTLGETMALLVAQEPGPLEQVQTFSKRLAGADSNVAIGLARLGFKVGWVSRLGADSFGRYVRQAIEAEGVDTSQVAVDPNRSTGFMLKSRSLDGSDPAIEYYRRNSAASQLGMANLPSAYALRARHLHATGITPALSASRKAGCSRASPPRPTSPPGTSTGAPRPWWSSSAPMVPISAPPMVRRAPCPACMCPWWSTPWAQATRSRWASSAPGSKAWAGPRRSSAQTGSPRSRCR